MPKVKLRNKEELIRINQELIDMEGHNSPRVMSAFIHRRFLRALPEDLIIDVDKDGSVYQWISLDPVTCLYVYYCIHPNMIEYELKTFNTQNKETEDMKKNTSYIKIKPWDTLKEEFGGTKQGNTIHSTPIFTTTMESMLPEDRVIEVYKSMKFTEGGSRGEEIYVWKPEGPYGCEIYEIGSDVIETTTVKLDPSIASTVTFQSYQAELRALEKTRVLTKAEVSIKAIRVALQGFEETLSLISASSNTEKAEEDIAVVEGLGSILQDVATRFLTVSDTQIV